MVANEELEIHGRIDGQDGEGVGGEGGAFGDVGGWEKGGEREEWRGRWRWGEGKGEREEGGEWEIVVLGWINGERLESLNLTDREGVYAGHRSATATETDAFGQPRHTAVRDKRHRCCFRAWISITETPKRPTRLPLPATLRVSAIIQPSLPPRHPTPAPPASPFPFQYHQVLHPSS